MPLREWRAFVVRVAFSVASCSDFTSFDSCGAFRSFARRAPLSLECVALCGVFDDVGLVGLSCRIFEIAGTLESISAFKTVLTKCFNFENHCAVDQT